MEFSIDRWREEVRQIVADFASDPQGALARAGVASIYGFLLGSALLPAVAAYARDPGAVSLILINAAGGLGATLISNIAQRRYDSANAHAIAATEAQSSALAPAYEAIARQTSVILLAEQALARTQQAGTLEQLRAELRRLGKGGHFSGAALNIQQSGGLNAGIGNTIGQIGDVVGGDKVAGDKVIGDKFTGNKYVEGRSSIAESTSGVVEEVGAQVGHLQALLEAHIRRLHVLEVRAARSGIGTPPEVQIEIDDIRSEIARITRLLQSAED